MDFSELVAYAAHTQVVGYFGVASTSILLYDYLVTLPMEIKYVWRSPWRTGKLLFFLTRYLALAETPLLLHHQFGGSLSPDTCKILYIITASSFELGTAIADAIITARTWVIWNNTRPWGIALALLFACVFGPATYIVGAFLVSIVFAPTPDPAIPGCYFVSASKILFIAYLTLMIYEILILVFTLIKGVDHLRHKSPLLLTTLYRDGLIFSIILAAISVTNIAVLAGMSSDWDTLLLPFQRVMHSVLSSRIILHMREASHRTCTDGLTTTQLEFTPSGVTVAQPTLLPETVAIV